MATVYSNERIKERASPVQLLKPNEAGGRVRQRIFTFTTANPTNVNIADVVELVTLPAGARITGGNIAFEAMGASATAQVGVSGTASKYSATIDVSAAGNAALANTIATNTLDELTASTVIQLTAAGANYAVTKKIYGHISYMLD